MVAFRRLLESHPDGLKRDELLRLAREYINPDVTAGQVEAELELLEDEIEIERERVRLRSPAVVPAASDPEPATAAADR